MQHLANAGFSNSVDEWLKGIVTGVLRTSDTVRIDRQDLWILLDSLPVAILISTDRECSRIIGNLAAQAMLQVPLGSNVSQSAPANELPGFKVYSGDDLVAAEDLPMQRAALTGQPVGRSECEIRFDSGTSIYIAGHCIPILSEIGEVCGSIGAFIDVTEQRVSSRRSAVIAREMSHRVKNSVSIIQALAHGTIRKRLDPEDYAAFEQRLVAIAHAQDLVGEDFAVGADLSKLIERAVTGVVQRDMYRVSWQGPPLEIDPDTAVSLSMVLHELATNACKYGALRHDEGSVSIAWSVSLAGKRERVTLFWKEAGALLGAHQPKPGFGTRLIRNVVRALADGSVTSEYLPDGLSIAFTFFRRDKPDDPARLRQQPVQPQGELRQ